MNSSDNFKDILNRKFRDFEELPPENDWEIFKSKFDLKRSRIRLYRRISVVSAIVVIAIIATIIVLYRNNESRLSPIDKLSNKDQQEKIQVTNPEKYNQQASDNSVLNNTSKDKQVPKLQPTKTNTALTSNIQAFEGNKPGKYNSDTGVKNSGKVLKEERPEKAPLQTLTNKVKINNSKADKPVIKTNSEENLPDKINNNTEPVVKNDDKTDSLFGNRNNIQPDKSVLTSPKPRDEITEPDIVNVITPNGDGINDKLVIKNIERFGTCTLNIYTSGGEKIYSSSNYQNSWDGTSKGKLVPEGTYYYVLETKDGKVFKGAVNILK